MTILPGRNEELSSTSINGFNIGINRLLETDSSENEEISNAEKLEAAIKVVEFISSKNLQKEFFIKKQITASIPSLLEDEEVCNVNDCELIKKMQPVLNNIYEINEKNGEIYDRKNYENRYRNIATNYLFNNNVSLEDTLRKIEDITKIYYIPLDKIDFSIGFVTVASIIAISFLMLISMIFLFFDNFQPFLKFLPIDSWFILISGIILILCSGLTNIEKLTITKCHLQISLLEIGITMYLSVILFKLVINLPSEIKFGRWVKKHKYLFLLSFISFDIILSGLAALNPYKIKNQIVEDGQNYKTCNMEHTLGKLIILIMSTEKFIYVLFISFLLFIEWNMKKIFYEVRFIMFAIYSNLLLLSISLIGSYIFVKKYYLNFIFQKCILAFTAILSYTCLYGFKLFLAIFEKKDLKLAFIDKISRNFVSGSDLKTQKSVEENDKSFTGYNDIIYDEDSKNNQQKKSLYSKIISYHYSSFSSITNDDDDDDNENNVSL